MSAVHSKVYVCSCSEEFPGRTMSRLVNRRQWHLLIQARRRSLRRRRLQRKLSMTGLSWRSRHGPWPPLLLGVLLHGLRIPG